jgi:hypothetical protein
LNLSNCNRFKNSVIIERGFSFHSQFLPMSLKVCMGGRKAESRNSESGKATRLGEESRVSKGIDQAGDGRMPGGQDCVSSATHRNPLAIHREPGTTGRDDLPANDSVPI